MTHRPSRAGGNPLAQLEWGWGITRSEQPARNGQTAINRSPGDVERSGDVVSATLAGPGPGDLFPSMTRFGDVQTPNAQLKSVTIEI